MLDKEKGRGKEEKEKGRWWAEGREVQSGRTNQGIPSTAPPLPFRKKYIETPKNFRSKK